MDPARDDLEVHFCNICNASIPESALREGKAVRIDDKVLPTASGEARSQPTGTGGVLAGAFVVLVAIAAAAVFLDWRLSEESSRFDEGLGGFSDRFERFAQRLDSIETRVQSSLAATDLEPLAERMADLESALSEGDASVGTAVSAASGRIDGLRGSLDSIQEEQVKLAARFALLHDEVRTLAREVADLEALPVPTQQPRSTPEPVGDVEESPPADDGLPPEIAHNAARLSDADDGARFDAVEKLLQTGDGRVFAMIRPLAKDSDMWVRRLVLEGLGADRDPETVDVLITALADPESIVRYEAYNSLKRVTEQDIPFDPDGSGDQRAAAQRRWKQWWDRNREEF